MDTLINHVAALWNPVAQISKRLEEEKLTVLDVLPLFMAILISGGLIVQQADTFFAQVLEASGIAWNPNPELRNSLIWNNEFAVTLVRSLLFLAPAGIVALLPERTFAPAGRNKIIAAIILLTSSWIFYVIAGFALLYFVSAIIGMVFPQVAIGVLLTGMILYSFGIVWLLYMFWDEAFSVLDLDAGFLKVSVCYLVSWFGIAAFSAWFFP